MKFLIVQQQTEIAEIWRRHLAREGAEVHVANSERDAIRLLRFEPFDALVLDMDLQDGNAVAVSEFARYRDHQIPVIAVTARSFFRIRRFLIFYRIRARF